MKEFGLQVILDREIVKERDVARVASKIIDAGASCIQLRDKISSDRTLLEEARDIKKITDESGSIFIINDRVDIAIAIDADGVHLGQDDLPCRCAREILGNDKIIGVSTHSIEQARGAQSAGADYIGVGPIFPTKTKPLLSAIGLDIVRRISREIDIPALFIGGIDLENIEKIIENGGRRFAIASAILNSRDIAGVTMSFLDITKVKEAIS